MKLTTFILTVFCVQVSAAVYSQKISLNIREASLKDVLLEIRRQSGYNIVYNNDVVEHAKPISLHIEGASLQNALQLALASNGLRYEIADRLILIEPSENEGKTVVLSVARQEVTGKVTDSLGRALSGATVRVVGLRLSTTTNRQGEFTLQSVPDGAVLHISYIGYRPKEVALADMASPLVVVLSEDNSELQEVVVNTGYQQIPKERATGSFDVIGNELINRSVSPDFLTRIENLTPGLLFNHGIVNSNNVPIDPFTIRGRSTITADAEPLIVLDNFPYEGELNNINPNDIESVSILKDAAAASIWGARAGNGVIVITTKRGKTTAPKVELTANLTVQDRPDLYNVQQISPADRIWLERYLFTETSRYTAAINPTNLTAQTTPIPEAVELMIQNPADLQARLNALASHDVRDDLSRYFYRTSANQQYNLNVSGNQERINYYMSGGFDRNLSNLVGESYNRVSIRSGNTFKVNDKLSVDASINFFQVNEERGNNNGYGVPSGSIYSFSPYTRLVDEGGNALPVYQMLRKGFVDTFGDGQLLDWNYRPVDEINNERHSVNRRDYLVNVGSNYKIINGLDAQIKYQYQNQMDKAEDLYREQSYYARNLINNFAQINVSTGAVTYPHPRGGILRLGNTETTSHQGRGQLNYNRDWDGIHALNALAGFEIRQVVTASNVNTHLGYNEETGGINNIINSESLFRQNITGRTSRVGMLANTSEFRDNFISYFSNVAYTYDRRYTLSASFRRDEANLFGLNTNQKGTPLWSIGGAWEASNESFYRFDWLPYLKLRSSYGVSGNISRMAHARSTMTLQNIGWSHQLPSARLNSPSNANLTWEKVKQLNFGLDFATKGNRLSGSIEYYDKKATDLLAQSPVDPTYGVSSMYLNVADMEGRGVDVQVRSINLTGALNWQTSLIYSYSASKVTNYLMPVATTGMNYLPISLGNPLVGRPLYSVFALAWEGLDPETGNPVGLVNGERSMDYSAIYNSTPLEDLVFMGTAQPIHFGAMLNTFSYRNFDLSFNLSFKSGYYFRRNSLNYSVLYSDFSGHSDFADRWQNPGDEANTDVPSMLYPANTNRDNFYQYSEVLVERGDHIRLEDLNIGYRFVPAKSKSIIQTIRVYAYLSNLGLLWASNSRNIDPYYNNTPLTRPNISFGTNIIF